jgi:hypothetical protein
MVRFSYFQHNRHKESASKQAPTVIPILAGKSRQSFTTQAVKTFFAIMFPRLVVGMRFSLGESHLCCSLILKHDRSEASGGGPIVVKEINSR